MRFAFGKTERALVVAFDSTASALAFDDAAKAAGVPGRLFPVPRSLSAGCGMAWRGDPSLRPQVEELVASEDIDDAHIVEMMLR